MQELRPIRGGGNTDQDLIYRYKQTNDIKFLGHLYSPYMDLVYGVCMKYLKDGEASKDAVMNIFEELVEKLKKHEVDNFKSWLYVVARNHCLMQLRKEAKVKITEMSDNFMQSEEDLHLNGEPDKETNLKFMEDCLEKLPEDQKRTVSLFYLESKCYQEIAELTGQEWNKVRSQIQNGRRNLKLCIENKQKEIQ
jgi:RNA polymerase sigma factor (sigma-70 family)